MSDYYSYDVSGGVTASLVAGNDTIYIPIRGAQWSTARWAVSVAGTATITTEYSRDGGVNWIQAPYSKRLDAVSANPSVAAYSNSAPVAGTFETQLPANATHFRLRCGTGGTATTIALSGGTPYLPGVPVVAVLADVTVTGGGANNTSALDGDGWSALSWEIVVATAASGVCSINEVDDTGAAIAVASSASLAVGTYAGALGIGVSMGTGITPVTGLTQIPLPKRFNFALAGATTSSIRLRAVARR